ncbi:gpi anchored cfem domain protein [Apiospora rasikravindrae]|uniref:Gpi anchored cfem domain protein n=1 Tax=Apiospora rasikravindrae TaxID=990691 RepID=A0ABR1U8W9_9PEZI
MQITHFTLSLFAAAAAAQSSSSNSTDLPSTVAQLPQCALKCYRDQATDVGCSPGDFSCVCGPKRQDFLKGIGFCIAISSGCSKEDVDKLQDLAPKICQSVSDNPSPSEVAKASADVASAVGAAPTESDKSAAMRPEIGFGFMGAAAAAAAAALAAL